MNPKYHQNNGDCKQSSKEYDAKPRKQTVLTDWCEGVHLELMYQEHWDLSSAPGCRLIISQKLTKWRSFSNGIVSVWTLPAMRHSSVRASANPSLLSSRYLEKKGWPSNYTLAELSGNVFCSQSFPPRYCDSRKSHQFTRRSCTGNPYPNIYLRRGRCSLCNHSC